jgi:hypothetical protein
LSKGQAKLVPWPDSFWPMMQDGYNWRWQINSQTPQDQPSPVELYDQAFNNWRPRRGFEAFMRLRPFVSPGEAYDPEYYREIGPAAAWAHFVGGNFRARSLTTSPGGFEMRVDRNKDGVVDRDLNDDGEVNEADGWGGLEDWYGHCHAWAPAALSLPEPQHGVVYRSVRFEVGDIKALINATFESGRSVFLGGRCEEREVERDEYGRIAQYLAECRDTNAGSFHIVLLNWMGIRGQSFVADVTDDYQVWNQPLHSYHITSQREVPLKEALKLLRRSDPQASLEGNVRYPYNEQAVKFVHVQLELNYVREDWDGPSVKPYGSDPQYVEKLNYEYLLEIDQQGKIIGGEWIQQWDAEEKTFKPGPHPDFLWAPSHRGKDVWYNQQPVIRVKDVKQLLELSRK